VNDRYDDLDLDLAVEDLSIELLADQLNPKGGSLSSVASLSTYSCASCPAACIATASSASTIASASAARV
jgi:hypothetical protein